MNPRTAFWDASGLVPLCCYQPATYSLRRFHRRHSRQAVWWGSFTEAYSSLARLRREGKLDPRGQAQARARLEILSGSWIEVLPTNRVREEATKLLDRFPLRAADSLQLAAALIWCQSNPRQRHFVCFDDRLAEAAFALGFHVIR